MSLSVESKTGWLTVLFACCSLATCLLLAPGCRPASPRVSADQPQVPETFAEREVASLRFYESSRGIPPEIDRVYRTEFPQSLARFINWELRLKHPKPGKKINFEIQAKYYTPMGKLLVNQSLKTFVKADWSNSNHSYGYGNNKPGPDTWPVGTYRVDLFIDGAKVASGSFHVHSGNEGKTIKKERKKKDINIPDDLGEL